MTTILRFILFFLLAPAIAIVAQAAGTLQNDFRIVDTGLRTESVILGDVDGETFSYDSNGALLQQRRSIDGEDGRNGYQELEISGAAKPLFSFLAEFVATNNTVKALPAPRQVDANLGAVNNYRHGGQMSAIEHINYRHASNSGFSNVSRFSEGTSVSNIRSYVDDALRYGDVFPQGTNGFKIEYDLGLSIGTNQTGGAASNIRVFIRDGNLQTAFPY